METRNPVLKSRTFSGYARPMELGESMTIQGTVNKTGVLLLLAFASAAWVWQMFYTSGNSATVGPYVMVGAIGGLIVALVIIVLFYFPAKIFILFLRRASEKNPGLEQVAAPATLIVRALFALVAVVIILENLGIHLTAVWTTLGVGSVAVALALQETLSNFFAGLYIMADRPIRPGDYIKLDSGQEGFVVRVGWRSTSIRMLANNLVVIPNSTLAKAVITNYSLPEDRMSYVLQVGVAYGSDPGRVEKALLEATRDAVGDRVPGLMAFPEPFVRFIPGFGDSSLDFSLIVQVEKFTDQYLVQSELRKRIVKRFEQEGIEIPFPVRTLVLDKSSWPALAGQKPEP